MHNRRIKQKAGQEKFLKGLNNSREVVIKMIGQVKDLSEIFDEDLAESIGTTLELFDTIYGAADEISSVVSGVGEATQATAQATSVAIQTVETASIILAVISAALKIATAIARLFIGRNDRKQAAIIKEQEKEYQTIRTCLRKITKSKRSSNKFRDRTSLL